MIGQILEGHTSSVTAIAATYVVTMTAVSTIVASASSDSAVIIWRRDDIAGNSHELYGFTMYNIHTIRTVCTGT